MTLSPKTIPSIIKAWAFYNLNSIPSLNVIFFSPLFVPTKVLKFGGNKVAVNFTLLFKEIRNGNIGISMNYLFHLFGLNRLEVSYVYIHNKT